MDVILLNLEHHDIHVFFPDYDCIALGAGFDPKQQPCSDTLAGNCGKSVVF